MNTRMIFSERGSSITELILGLLEDDPQEAATIKKDLELIHEIALEPSQFYRALTVLERRGLVDSPPLNPDDPFALRTYSLTEAGRVGLQHNRSIVAEQRTHLQRSSGGMLFIKGGIMTFAGWIVKCYPRAWRERYEAEMLAVLDDHHITFLTFIDLLFGALRARLDPYYRSEQSLAPRRHSVSIFIFLAALVAHLLLIQGNLDIIYQGVYALPFSTVFFQVGNLIDFTYILLFTICATIVLRAIARALKARRFVFLTFAAACFALPGLLMQYTQIWSFTYSLSITYSFSSFWSIINAFSIFCELELVMGVLVLSFVRGVQAIKAHKIGQLSLVVLTNLGLAILSTSILTALSALVYQRGFLLGLQSVLLNLAPGLLPTAAAAFLLLTFFGRAIDMRTWKFVSMAASLLLLVMLAYLFLFLVGISPLIANLKYLLVSPPPMIVTVSLALTTGLAFIVFCSVLKTVIALPAKSNRDR